MRMVLNRKSW